jgi:hypothetical protein
VDESSDACLDPIVTTVEPGLLKQALLGVSLLAGCVVIHAVGITAASRRLRHELHVARRFSGMCWLFIRLAALMVFLHLGEITLWASLYAWQGAIPDLVSALYFSGVTYTTTGYGDVVLPVDWRLAGAVESLTGILMCGWSTGFFFAVFSRVLDTRSTAASA